MNTEAIVIRIKTPTGDMDSSVDCPSLLNFNDLLVAIRDVMPEATVTAFECFLAASWQLKASAPSTDFLHSCVALVVIVMLEDPSSTHYPSSVFREGDSRPRYCNTMNEQRMNGLLPDPLQIFPRAGKTPGIRNIHGLKVNTRPNPANDCSHAVPDSIANNSLKKSSAELKRILTNGQINAQDIHYQEQLGHGNGGTVYKAYHVHGKRVLAVKVIPLDITVELQKQIMSELEILYKCDSPYIITFFSAFFVENRISICTEFMDGGSLDVYKRIPEHVLGRIAVAVVKGLTYLWSLKILHRDVKPSNMLVNTRGRVKLCDFGVSTQLVNSIAKTYVGTNAYMAPERISGEQYGIHADVWSAGISFMELALGMFPYPQIQKNQGSLMPLQLLQCIVDEDPPVLPVSQFSEKFVHFITQCMRRNPKERPAPNNLMDHPFIVQYNDGNAEVVSMWVCRCLEERRAQLAQGRM
ncbi:dual specificity mitogen-activated protein kinase kinase 5 [Neolamprologus brichardi]|uniref:dual specificity mitogen-activated protein kinase kinase 5 n=1 Tax=Neolamprologus brichardi TaxID=32507 RepID=UPI0016439A8D|nr:dual specificity mitogen-activated protein kinase kinase 5 [Neolamprologus brichardi]